MLLAAGAVHADPLDDAHRLEAALDYDRALAVVDAALRGGVTDPARYVELHLLGGKLAAGLDRGELAQRHFAIVLALRPTADLPDGTSPKLVGPFDAARKTTVALAIAASIDRGVASVAPGDDPLGLVVGIAVRVDGRDLVARATTRIALPAGAVATEIAALDREGNHIWSTPIAIAVVPPPPPPHHTGLAARWSTWTIIAGGLAAVGGVAAWRYRVAQDDWNTLRAEGGHDYSTLVTVEDRGRRDALIADVGLGLAAASAIAAVIFAVRGAPEPAVQIIAGPGSLGVAGRF